MSGYDNLLAEIKRLQALIADLEHQHKNDECASRMLLAEIERMKSAEQSRQAELDAELVALKQRIADADKQAPAFVDFKHYGYANDNSRNESWNNQQDWNIGSFIAMFGDDWKSNDSLKDVVFHHYALPPIPPDVAELQQKLSASEADVKMLCEAGGNFHSEVERIARTNEVYELAPICRKFDSALAVVRARKEAKNERL